MKLSSKRSKKNSAGFIITLEFLLVMALVVMPILLGLFMVGRKLVTLYLNNKAMVEQPLSRPVVWDSSNPGGNAKPVGPVIGYDKLGEPLVLYRDNTAGSAIEFPGVLLGVRPNRFTTVSNVYYSGANCTGTAYVKSPSAALDPWPEVGYVSQTQTYNYAVGNGNVLYRATGAGAPLGSGSIASVWTSQDIGDASPDSAPSTACQNLTFAAEAAPFANFQVLAALSANTDGIALAITAANHNLRTGDLVSINTATAFCPGQPGGVCPNPSVCGNPPTGACPSFMNGRRLVTVTSPHSFTYDTGLAETSFTTNTLTYTANCPGHGAGAVAPFSCPVSILPGIAFTLVSIPDLVAADTVADLTSAANFTAPFKLAFPTAIPYTGTVGGSGG